MLKPFKIWIVGMSLVAVIFGLRVMPVYAATPSTESIASSYGTDGTLRQGMIVGLKPGSTTKVVPLSRDRMREMLGVVITASDAPVTLSGETSVAQVYVATSGQYNVLVSNQNGPIHAGDYVSASSLNGVGMKAEATDQVVLGKASQDFAETKSRETSVATLKSNGGSTTVVVGLVTVNIAVGNNPNVGHGTGDLPGFLQLSSNNIAGKPVAAARVYLSLAVLLITAFIAGSLAYGGVRNTVVSIGRNPLAKRSITKGLLQIVLVSVIIFIIGLFAVYLLLRL
jgi:hypothetical protein